MCPLTELFFCSPKHAKIGARERGRNGVTGMEKEGMERSKQKRGKAILHKGKRGEKRLSAELPGVDISFICGAPIALNPQTLRPHMEKTFPTPEVELNRRLGISLEADMAAETLSLSHESHLNSSRVRKGSLGWFTKRMHRGEYS